MDAKEYKYLEDTLSGRRERDPEFESRLSDVADPRAAERQRQLDSKTPEERELEQREFSLTTYGKAHMEKYSTPIVSDRPLGRLQVLGDQIMSDASSQIHVHKEESKSAQQVKGHNAEKPGPWCDANGKLLLQNHAACPIKQVLKVY